MDCPDSGMFSVVMNGEQSDWEDERYADETVVLSRQVVELHLLS